MSQEFTDKTYQEIEAYILKRMSDEQAKAFEERMQADDLLQKEVALQQSLHSAFNEKDWDKGQYSAQDEAVQSITNKLNSKPYQDASQNIQNAAEQYFKEIEDKTSAKPRFSFYKIAIAATILLLISLPFFLSQDGLDAHYAGLAQWNDVPSLIEKNNSEHAAKGETLFQSKKYKELVTLYATEENLSPYDLIYLGIAQLELGQHSQALQTFDQLIASKHIEHSRGYWYKLLVYIKENDEAKAKTMIDRIRASKEHYNYDKALDLAKKINYKPEQ